MLDGTRQFSMKEESDKEMKRVLQTVYDALKEKGYNPINQIVGYLLSEDPTYITNYNNARSLICRIDRDELLQHLVDAGYERVDLVERRGHFSVRGDIVDIYAVNEPQPLRLEFFGDELDSLRTFDVDSQKSQEQREKARILPISLTVQDDEKYTLLDYAE